ncbi:hypothetical protein OAT77_01410 [Alphaproteobacteria bacterium]|nr:hypothetical protein [Alphaproteobacteria bacterium]
MSLHRKNSLAVDKKEPNSFMWGAEMCYECKMQNPEEIKAWAERQKDDQFSTADDKRRKKLKSLMRDFSKILPQGLTVKEAARHPLNIVMFDIFDELKARYIDIETLEGSLVQPELLYFVAKITQKANDTSEPSGDFDKNGNLVQ